MLRHGMQENPAQEQEQVSIDCEVEANLAALYVEMEQITERGR